MPFKHAVRNTVQLDESVIRLAETLAERYGVTVQKLIEALIVGCAERRRDAGAEWASSTPAPVESRWRRGPGNLIVLRGGENVQATASNDREPDSSST
jgi:hypothetical protein